MDRVVHELVEQEHAVDAPMLPLDRILHAVEDVEEIRNLVDVQVVLVVAVLEQLCSSLQRQELTKRLRTQAVAKVEADYRNERHDGLRGRAVDALVALRRLRHDGLVADHGARARLRSRNLHGFLFRVLLDDRHVDLLVVGVGRRRVRRRLRRSVQHRRDGDVGRGGRRRQRRRVEDKVEGYSVREGVKANRQGS